MHPRSGALASCLNSEKELEEVGSLSAKNSSENPRCHTLSDWCTIADMVVYGVLCADA